MKNWGTGSGGSSDTAESDLYSPRDLERAEAIMEAVGDDTAELFGVLRNGMTGRSGARAGGGGKDARDRILQTFGEIRSEAFQEAADSARRFAAMCMGAADQVNDVHNRRIARCVAELFEEFAQRVDRVHPVARTALRDDRNRDEGGDEGTAQARRDVARGRRDGDGEEAGIGLIVDNQPRR
ncbi:hypothetical protein ACFOGJ_15935 [Marinibaculum pumilum]|uniref:Uncharacterized protein n=1 Tax=Marinibaculum pumilum TaxID=1766165 RepID=A0ABV7L2V6_9PROT